MTAKKTTKKKPAKKATKVAATAFDDAFAPTETALKPNPEYENAIEPVLIIHPSVLQGPTITIPESTDPPFEPEGLEQVFDADDFNEFAPDMGMGRIHLNEETGEWIEPDVPTVETGTAGSPVEAISEPVTTSATPIPHTVPQTIPDSLEGPSDAQIVERLINAVNHFYTIARLTKGAKGPQIAHVSKVVDNIKLARLLIQRLK